jgi:hypothetical protein
MKTFIIILLLLIASCSAISYHFFYSGEIGKSDKELEKVVEKGKIIIDALEDFKKSNGEYPEDLDSIQSILIMMSISYMNFYIFVEITLRGNLL